MIHVAQDNLMATAKHLSAEEPSLAGKPIAEVEDTLKDAARRALIPFSATDLEGMNSRQEAVFVYRGVYGLLATKPGSTMDSPTYLLLLYVMHGTGLGASMPLD